MLPGTLEAKVLKTSANYTLQLLSGLGGKLTVRDYFWACHKKGSASASCTQRNTMVSNSKENITNPISIIILICSDSLIINAESDYNVMFQRVKTNA